MRKRWLRNTMLGNQDKDLKEILSNDEYDNYIKWNEARINKDFKTANIYRKKLVDSGSFDKICKIENFKNKLEKGLKGLNLSDELAEKRTNEIIQSLLKDMKGNENI